MVGSNFEMDAPVKKKEPKDPSWVRPVRVALERIPCQFVLVAVYIERNEIIRIFTREDKSAANRRVLGLGLEAIDFFERQEARQKAKRKAEVQT